MGGSAPAGTVSDFTKLSFGAAFLWGRRFLCWFLSAFPVFAGGGGPDFGGYAAKASARVPSFTSFRIRRAMMVRMISFVPSRMR